MIIAIDFDGVLCEDRFPEIGSPDYEMVSLVRQLIDAGHEVVLWTCRVDARLDEAVAWCEDRGLHFCAVNENAPSNRARWAAEYPNGTRKVYADLYVEDHDVLWRSLDRMHVRNATHAPKPAKEFVRHEIRRILENGGIDNE